MVLRNSIANSLTQGGHTVEDFAGSQKAEDRPGPPSAALRSALHPPGEAN
jgi:hypothetical protein